MGQFRYGCLSAKKRVSDVAFSNESVVCAVQRLALVWGYSSRSSPPFFSSLIPSVSCPFSSIRCVHCLVFFEPPSACHQFFSKVLYVVQSPSLQKAAARNKFAIFKKNQQIKIMASSTTRTSYRYCK
ncbi:uncharacterized protein [Primulina huaijiensis]|uniref:uncharacterized protein isoform X2 n=1 Tax=Primulina huaijiensis TaxID=1492673 RepID=UPI003CC72996